MNKLLALNIFLLLVINTIFAQNNPMIYKRWNTMKINKVATVFDNVGMLNNGNNQNYSLARTPSFEYPQGSGLDWGTCVAVVVGAPADQDSSVVGGVNPDHLPYLDGAMDEGPADFWNEEHFAPYPEFVNSEKASMSDDPASWPDTWPDYWPNYVPEDGMSNNVINFPNLSQLPILRDSATGWPGFGKNGKQLADEEMLSMTYGWGGTDQLGSGNSKTRWLRTQMMMRGMAWKGTLYDDFIVWVFIIRNPNNVRINDVRMGVHLDFGYLPEFIPGIGYDDDRHYFDPNLQLAYGTDDDGYEEDPLTGGNLSPDKIAWSGVVALKMPGGNGKIKTYDAAHFWQGQTSPSGSGGEPEMYYKWNLLNLDDPQDSDGDGIDDDFDGDGIPDVENGGPNYYVGTGADGLQIIGSSPFTMSPGETDTLIFATVFGLSEKDLKTNTKNAITLYENNWEIVDAPPAPKVQAYRDDRKVVLVWDTESETDYQFEGYKIYRSADNGQTWGDESFLDFEGGTHYIPLAQFDKPDGVIDYYQTLPEYAWYYLGDDNWSQLRTIIEGDSIKGVPINGNITNFNNGDSVNVYIDRTVLNGINYRYYVAAYDSGNGIIGPLENSSSPNPYELNNTIEITPELPLATHDLSKVRVVPNPYKITEIWETGFAEHTVQFTGLPNKATIRIFNTSGELIRKLEHNNVSSIEKWNMKNRYNQLVAPGVYFYHIASALGEKTGKIFVIL
jgi:hypothetical protein